MVKLALALQCAPRRFAQQVPPRQVYADPLVPLLQEVESRRHHLLRPLQPQEVFLEAPFALAIMNAQIEPVPDQMQIPMRKFAVLAILLIFLILDCIVRECLLVPPVAPMPCAQVGIAGATWEAYRKGFVISLCTHPFLRYYKIKFICKLNFSIGNEK